MPWLWSSVSCGELRPSLLVPHLALPSNAPPSPKSESHQLGLWPWAPWGWKALSWTGNVTGWPIWERAPSCWNTLIFLGLRSSLSRLWPKTCGSFSDLESKRNSAGTLFSSGWGGPQPTEVCVHGRRPSGRWVCVYTDFISTLKMLLFRTVELDFFFPVEMIFSYLQSGYQYLFLKVLGLILLLNWNACLVFHSVIALCVFFFLTTRTECERTNVEYCNCRT